MEQRFTTVIEPEFNLAVASCRWSFSGEGSGEISKLASEVDWQKFLRLIRRHRVQPLVNSAFSGSRLSPPAEVAAAISADSVAIAERNLRSAAESKRLLEAFAGAGVSVLFVKGLTLSALAYGDPFAKMGKDIDILVEVQAVPAAASILSKLGYRPTSPLVDPLSPAIRKWHGRRRESTWRNTKSGLNVDLHGRLCDNRALMPAIGMDAPRQEVPIASGLSLPTLTTEDLFTYLCVHGTWSAWSRLKWITDLAALMHRSGSAETERLYRRAITQKAGRAPAQALLLADRLFGLSLSSSLRTELTRDPVNRLLLAIALRELRHERVPPDRFLGTLVIHLARPLVLPGWRFKFAETQRQLRDLVQRATVRMEE